MNTKSIQGKTAYDIKTAFNKCIADGFKPSLAFVFIPALDELKKVIILLDTENRSVLCGQPIKEGTTFRFSLPPDFDVIDTVIDCSGKIKIRKIPEAYALVVFLCVIRLMSFRPMTEEEINRLSNNRGKPAAIFFSTGELRRVAGGKPEFYCTDSRWVAIRKNNL